MKKITWFFMSLMLLLGVGTASAQPSAPVLITPLDGDAVEPGQPIKFVQNADYVAMNTVLLYTFDATASLDVDMDDLGDIMENGPVNGVYGTFLMAAAASSDDPDDPTIVANWMPTPTIPSDASGTVTLRARVLSMTSGQFSGITTATYTVGAATPVPAPTFSKPSGSVPTGTKITVNKPVIQADGYDYDILYVLDNPDFDFTQYKCSDNSMCEDGPVVPYNQIYKSPIAITKNTTITVITMKYDSWSEKIAGWSEKATATYTIGGEVAPPAPKPAAPTFNPDGGEIASGVKITLTNGTESEATPLKIYYNFNDDNGASITKFTTQEALDKDVKLQYTATVFLYAEPGIEITEAKNIQALTANVNEDGLITWSDVTAKAFTIAASVEPPVAPTFNPNGGEVTLDQQISLATTTEGVSIYYTMESEMVPDFSTITTEEDLEEASMFMLYDDDDKITLGNFIFEEDLADGDVEVTLMAAAAVIKDGNVTWSTTTKAPFTVKGIEPPAGEVAQPVITPDGSEGHATIKLNEKVTITCATNGASIYYTLDGSTPDATKTLYEAPFLLPANTPVDQEITIRAIAIKDGVSSDPRRVALMVEAAGEGPDDPVTPPATPKAPSFNPTTGNTVAVGSKITITGYGDYPIYYVIGGSDEDFNLTYAQLKGTNNLTQYNEGTPITVTAAGAMTIKAAAVNIDETHEVVAWSTIKEAQYTAVERPVAPTFDPDGGEITETTQITLTNGTEGDETPLKIYYTRKGEASIFDTKLKVSSLNSAVTGISKSLWLYEGPLTTTKDTTIHAATAKIIGEGNNAAVVWSEPVTRRFTIAGSTPVVPETPVAPTFDPNGGDIKANAEITITSTCSSCKIYYTNGTTASFVNITTKEDLEEQVSGSMAMFFEYSPNAKPMLSEFAVETPGAKLSLSAAAVSIAANGTLTWSDVTTKEFTVIAGDEPEPDVATPTITPGNDPGTARIGQMVTIECTTGDATIYYTIDKSEPTAQSIKYTEPFAITEDMMVMQTGVATPNGIVTVRAIAIKDGKTSELTRGTWEIIPNAPSFSVTEEEVVAGTKVEIKCVPAVAKIYYTIDGTVPTEGSTVYTDPVEITSAMTLKAFAVLGQRESSVNTASYTIKEAPVVDPEDVTLTFNPASGATVEEGAEVTITANARVEIFYMMFESEAAAKAAEWDQDKAESYSEEMKPVVSKERNTLKVAYALEGAEALVDTFFYATYTINEQPAITLTFNPASGSEVKDSTTVTVTASRETEIYYNLYADSAAAAADTLFIMNAKKVNEDGMPVITENNTYLRCGVYDRNEMKFFYATYTIKGEDPVDPVDPTANEGKELAGVSVYPNPNNGMFYIELPVAATVDVFASNGVLVKSFTAPAGKATLSLDHSGIYFVRIVGEGRATVKRVIVR